MSNKTILAIDDDITAHILVSEIFSLQDYQVVCVSSGAQALECIHAVRPDVILLDIVMPGMDGFETCSLIKAIPDFFHTPIIMLTGHDDVETVEKSYRSGASDFISKPVNWPILTRRVEYALRAAKAFANVNKAARLSRALDISPTESLIFEGDALQIVSANASVRKNLDYTETAIEGLTFQDIVAPPAATKLGPRILNLGDSKQIKLNLDFQRRDGSRYPVEGFVIYLAEERSHCYIGIFQDISERKRSEAELYKLAFYDVLTGLPNRRLLQIHVERMLTVASRNGTICAVCILDLDGFKTINDTLGHNIGDLLLKEVAERLSGVVREVDTVTRDASIESETAQHQISRLGGDEFLLLLSEIGDASTAARVVDRVLKEIALPYIVKGDHLHITGSIGIALYPEDGTSLEQLMMRADTAMYEAKEAGRNRHAFFREKTTDETDQKQVSPNLPAVTARIER